MSLSVLLCALIACLLIKNGVAHTSPSTSTLTQPYTMREDFQSDSLGQWASYPPAQDIGYEPSLSPTTDYGAPGGRASMRTVKPNRAGTQRFGFIKKIRMTIDSDSRVRFAYRLNSPTTGGTIEVGLAGIDARPYATKLTTRTNEWNVVDVSVNELGLPKTGVGVEAVYVVANIPQGDPDVTYRFIIDDVTISGARATRFDVTAPRTELIEPWPELISAQSYRSGETVIVEARAPVPIVRVDCSLETQTERVVTTEKLYDDGTHGDKAAGDGIWSNNAVYNLRPSDPEGIWLAHLRGTTSDGKTVKTSVRVVVRPQKAVNHPHLFFDAADRQKLIERSRNPKLATLWSYLQTTAKTARASGELAHGGDVFELLDTEYLLPSLLGYFDVLNRARSRIAHNALEAYITGSEEPRTAAKAALLDVARWKHWEPPWFRSHGQHTYYPAGLLAADVALGYDLLYDDLSESERALVRRALFEKSIVPTFKEYVADNRLMANTSNWIAHTVGGALIAAATIANDLRDGDTDGRFEIYLGGLLRKLEDHIRASFLPDGSYGEGISYQEFDLETLAPAIEAVRRAFGVDYWKHTHVLESLAYPIYTLAQPISGSPDMGDTHPPAGHGIPALVYRSKEPLVRWYYSQFDRPSLSKFIFYDESIAPQPPTLPNSRIFSQKGNAVFRSGWAADDMVFLFRAGPTFNHHHSDQGSFLLTAFGEALISEAGWSDYYKDPYYATFFTQAVGHNTVLVDGNPESQTIADTLQFPALNSYPHITDSITSAFYDGVGSELSSVYQNRLARYVRRIVFVKPSYFVVFDDLKVNGQPARFDFLLHLPNREKIKTKDLTAIYNGDKASLVVRSFLSNAAKLSVENGRIPYHIFAARTPTETTAQTAYLAFRTLNPMNEAQFLTALVPGKNEGAAQSLSSQITEIAGDNLKGIRVTRAAKTDLVMFRRGMERQTIRHGEWVADAATLTITLSTNDLEIFAVHNARSLRRGNQVLFSSDHQVSVAASFSVHKIEATYNAETAARITLFVGKKPVRVLLDSKEVNANAFSFNRSDGTISLGTPSSQHDLKIMFR
ncbi:MAG TPA: heparinase II/III family protein [Pyrinomonadaceae bacterium]|nr:heparinase II/III family protein [Pyrinomonadaceae bacterium]